MKGLARNKILLYVSILVFLSACVSVRKIEIEVANPPEKLIAEDIQSILMINGSLTPDFKNYRSDSLEALFIGKSFAMDTILLDSVAADTALQLAGKYLYESSRFDVVIPVDRNIDHSMMPDNKKRKLTREEVSQLCQDFKTDAVLVLNHFEEKVRSAFGRYYSGIDLEFMDQVYYGKIEVSYFSEWFLLKPGEESKEQRFVVSDTIYWEMNDFSLQDMYNALPSIKEALVEGGGATGERFAKMIGPLWTKDRRFYFLTGNKEADQAVALIKENKWEEASLIWNRFADNASSAFRSKIEFNLALASEMSGDLKKALEWGNKSFQSRYRKETDYYLRKLNKRNAELNDLGKK